MHKSRSGALIAAVLIAALVACSSGYELMVKSYNDPETDFGKFRSFAVLPMTKGNPALQRELLFQVKITMINKGYKYNPVKPDFLIAVDLLNNTYTPPGEIRIKTLQLQKEQAKASGPEPVIKADGPDAAAAGSYPTIVIMIADTRNARNNAPAPVVWEGVAQGAGDVSGMKAISSPAVREILEAFPGSGPNAERRVRVPESSR